jgi:hypothetical protein
MNLRLADDFREVLAEGARIAGHLSLEAEIRDGRASQNRRPVDPPKPAPERDYPPREDVHDLWSGGSAPADDPEASGYLVRRLLDPQLVTERGLARVIADPLPSWASYRRSSWEETGHRLIVRAFDATGRMRSVRAMRIRDGESPKRLPPGGFKAAELALLNASAWRMLRGEKTARVVVIVEGEPDWLTWSTRIEEPVVGILTGTWTPAFAMAIPRMATVTIRTHTDDAGNRYAQTVIESLDGKRNLRRATPEAA